MGHPPGVLVLLLLSVGPITWGLSLRRHSPAPGVRQMLALSGAAALAALALEADPWHDLSLVIMYAAWTALGVLLLRRGVRPASGLPGHAARGLGPAPRSKPHSAKDAESDHDVLASLGGEMTQRDSHMRRTVQADLRWPPVR